MNNINEEEKQIKDIALNVISGYKSKLLEHMQTTIIKTITEGLEDHLKKRIENDKITDKIVEANVTNFNDLLSGREDKSLSNVYSDLLNFDKVCKAEKAKGGRPKRKKYTRKSHRKRNKQQTRRVKGAKGVKGGEGNGCIDVSAICKMVTMKIIEQTEKFKTEIETTDDIINKLKEDLRKICLSKTDELLDDFAKQAIDISSLDDIFKMLIFEITNVVKSNMKELDKTICKKSNKT